MALKKTEDTNFPVKIKSSLAGDLLVDSMSGEEEMGRLFEFHLELMSENAELHFDKVVGQQVTVSVVLDSGERYFNGYITEFRYTGAQDRFSRYQATVRPWFWFLTRTSDCRIFQEMTVPDIIKQVFSDNGMADFKDLLKGKYRTWEYCVQYRESDFNFISRLMEQEGIYYYFEHESERHVLVMADDVSAHSPFPNYKAVPFHAKSGSRGEIFEDHLDSWTPIQSIMPNKYAVQDFNFKNPNTNLLSKNKLDIKHDMPPSLDPEIYDYPGEYPTRDDGENYAKIRLQELKCQQERIRASGTSRGMAPGFVFALEDHPRDDQVKGKKYLVLSISHYINNKDFDTGGGGSMELYHCDIEVMDKNIPFRAERRTAKPMVQGPQTAIVVGPANDEIYTDPFGRVKVQFHWDRYGKDDENSSCWVRVSQLWAGKRWGAMHIPRIGQEVIVSFMEGDPDRPIITGRVYNAVNMPPYELEGNKTQSGIKSRSTQDGGPDNFNELRFEDKKGSEEVYLHAEKDLTIKVEDAEAETVGTSITTNAGASISRSAGADISRTADDNIHDKANIDITTTSGKNMMLEAGGAYALHTNLSIHLKAMNFVASKIESGAKAAAEALQKGGGGSPAAMMEGGGADSAQGAKDALSPAIMEGAAALTSFTDSASDSLSDQAGDTEAKASALSDAIESGASPEATAGAFMDLAASALDTLQAPMKMVEGLIEKIPNIELWAMKDVNAHALWSMTLSTKTRDIDIQAMNKDINIGAKKNVTIEASTKDVTVKAKDKISIKAEDNDVVIEAEKKKVKITSAKQIFLKCGKASISMADSGNIVIKGAKINITGSSAVTMRGKPIKQN
ncbi:MAG: type VI secretion system tip protein VgrG [Xanthomonadales bacterium]|nr:type VI secretion system tip protein VgrG [Xanthomonadales bacterium]MDH4020457.1 type VI secretion system tip protein VgrG [Xanthomonadales bacterium]